MRTNNCKYLLTTILNCCSCYSFTPITCCCAFREISLNDITHNAVRAKVAAPSPGGACERGNVSEAAAGC